MKSIAKILSALFLVVGFAFSAHHVSAAVLLPGDINTCGELAVGGTYTLTSDVTGPSDAPCFVITSDDVTIDGAGHLIDAVTPDAPAILVGSQAGFVLTNATASSSYATLVDASAPVSISGANLDISNKSIFTSVLTLSYSSTLDKSGTVTGGLDDLIVNGSSYGSQAAGPLLMPFGIDVVTPGPDEVLSYWLRNIAWGSNPLGATSSCYYSYDDFSSTSTADCALSGADVFPPAVGAATLSLRQISSYGDEASLSRNFTFLNSAPLSNDWVNGGPDTGWSSANGSPDFSRINGGGSDGRFYYSKDYGKTWSYSEPLGSSWTIVSRGFSPSKSVALSYGDNGMEVKVSTDDFLTHTTLLTGLVGGQIGVSSDGQKMVLTQSGGYVRTSVDGGDTWTVRTDLGQQAFDPAYVSGDGSLMAVGVHGGSIYTSTDDGANWTERTDAGSGLWSSISISNDGTKLVGVQGAYGSGYIHTSTDSGETWIERTDAGNQDWQAVSMSDDGLTILATFYPSGALLSKDGGETWTDQSPGGGVRYYGLSVSADGNSYFMGPLYGTPYVYNSTNRLSIINPLHGDKVSVWSPTINWATTTGACSYSYNGGLFNVIDCLGAGVGIPEPQPDVYTTLVAKVAGDESTVYATSTFQYLPLLSAGNIDSCGTISAPGTYTITSNIGIGEDCLSIRSDGVTVNAATAGITINGDVVGDGFGESALNGRSFTLSDVRVTGSITSNSYSSGGVGGAITISGTDVDLSDNAISATGVDSSGGLTVTYSGTLTTTNTVLSEFQHFTLNRPMNPLLEAYFPGGPFPSMFPGDTVSSASQCPLLVFPGTYSVASFTGDCVILVYGVILDGGGTETITGSVTGDGTESFVNGKSFTLSGVRVTGDITSDGYSGGGGVGGSITISGTDVDLSGNAISATGDEGNGTLTVTYFGTLTTTDVVLSAFADFVFNRPVDPPGSVGAFPGGAFPLLFPGDTVSSASQCPTLVFPGTYVVESFTGDCTILHDEITLDGGGTETITGNVTGADGSEEAGGSIATKGIEIRLSNISVTGNVTAGDAGYGNLYSDGGVVFISGSTILGVISAGDSSTPENGSYDGGNGGSVTITDSTIATTTAGNGGWGFPGVVATSTTTTIGDATATTTIGDATASTTVDDVTTSAPSIVFDSNTYSYSASGDTWTYDVYAYRSVPGGRVYSSNPLTFSGVDDGSMAPIAIGFSWDAVEGADGYRIVVINDAQYPASGEYYLETTNTNVNINVGVDLVSGNSYAYEDPVVVTPTSYLGPSLTFSYGAGMYTADGSTWTYDVYAYRSVPGGRVYSSNPLTFSGVDDGSMAPIAVGFSWDAVEGADGYRIVVINDAQYPASGEYYLETTNTNVNIGDPGYDNLSNTSYVNESPVTVTPAEYSENTEAIDGTNGGIGGSVTITNSTMTGDVTAGLGGSSGVNASGGSGGSVTISGDGLGLSGITVSSGFGTDLGCGGSGCGNPGTDGSVAISYSSLVTNASTRVYTGAGEFTVNGVSRVFPSAPGWNGVFNPLIYYFYDGPTGIQPFASGNGNWADAGNWYTQGDYSVQNELLPLAIDEVIINASVTQNTGDPAEAYSVMVNGNSVVGIDINVKGDVSFNGGSFNNGLISTGGIISFNGQSTNNGSTSASQAYFNGGSVNNGFVSVMEAFFNASSTNNGRFGLEGAETLNDGLVAAYDFDGNLNDSSGNGSGGTIVGNVSYVSGFKGDAVNIDLSYQDGHIQISDIDMNGDRTLSAWSYFPLNSGTYHGWRTLFQTGEFEHHVIVSVDGYLGLYNYGFYDSGYNINGLTGWHQIMAVGSSGSTYFYIDGTLVGSVANQLYTPLRIIGNYVGCCQPWGSIDGVAVWNRALTTNEIEASYRQGVASNNLTFSGDLSNNNGSSTGSVTRLYAEAASTTRNFVTEGGRNDWIVIAQGVVVDLASAVYDVATNLFRALAGGWFVPNPAINGGAHVVPLISISTSTLAYTGEEDTKTIKWKPLIDWDTAAECLYSYDGFATTYPLNCSSADASLPRPEAGEHTLSLRGTDANGGVAERSLTFWYDNTAPLGIDSADAGLALDEATRPYYYIASDISFPLAFSVDAELRGSSTNSFLNIGGFVLDGSVDAQGHNLTIKNARILGEITSNGASGEMPGGSISVYDSVTGAIIANGAYGYYGGAGGIITIATSTTGAITANGGDGETDGGAGGVITITNSLGSPLASTITANGGSSTSCGNGGDAGQVTLTDSSYGLVTAEPGEANVGGCPSESRSSGTRHSATVVGVHSSQASSAGSGSQGPAAPARTAAGTSEVLRGFRKATALSLSTVSLPVNLVGRLPALAPLPAFGGTGKGSFSFESPVARFLFEPLPEPLVKSLAPYPRLSAYLASAGVTNAQALVRLSARPLAVISADAPGTYSVSAGNGRAIRTTLSSDGKTSLFQEVSVRAGETFDVFVPKGGKASSATFDGKAVSFGSEESLRLTAPAAAGSYILKSDASPIALVVRVQASSAASGRAASATVQKTLWQRILGLFGR